MQQMQTFSSRGLCKSATSTSAKRKNGRQHALQRDRRGLCQTREIPQRAQGRAKSLCDVVLLQPNPHSVSGIIAQFGDYRVHQESEAFNCQKRTTVKDLFGQRSDVCRCSQVAKESTERSYVVRQHFCLQSFATLCSTER